MNLFRGPATRMNAWRWAARREGLRPPRAWRAPVRIEDGEFCADAADERPDLEIFDDRGFTACQPDSRISPNATAVIRSPMPGRVVEVCVEVGDRVRTGSAVAVMEAMKMQNEILSEVDGIVKAVNVKARDSVESQFPLVEVTGEE